MPDRIDMFELEGLKFSYSGEPVLSIGHFRIAAGEIVGIQGDNGSGKTTLLKLLGGLLQEHSGRLAYMGVEERKQRIAMMQDDSVYVHQNPYLFSGSVHRNISAAIPPQRSDRRKSSNIVFESLRAVDLGGFEHRNVRKLSGGEVKRVSLARAIAANPTVLLLDEPTAGVDSKTTGRITELIRGFSSQNRTIILSTHEPDLAYRVSDRLVLLKNGNIHSANLNIFKGTALKTDASFLYFSTGGCELKCPIRKGAFTAAVLPYDDVILSERKVSTSAQNQVIGTVERVTPIDGRHRVSMDCGVKMVSHVTGHSVSNLNITVGKTLYAIFKASAVQLY